MKLIDLVQRIEAAGLTPELTYHAYDNSLQMHAKTKPSGSSWPKEQSEILLGVIIEGSKTVWPADAVILGKLEKAAGHPHAVRYRDIIEKYAQERAVREAGKNAAA
jgi:hypothetical protein